jgi:flagellum-specific peptidoglycan hydrolase FlgJ
MKKIIVIVLLTLLSNINIMVAQSENLAQDKVSEYIAKYRDLAIYEQIRVGIPAAITLAQGIHESAAGTSELSISGNNHFGIKCKNNWEGETIMHDDETKNECFRKYESDKASYTDHSNYIRNNRRYSFLFDIPVNNYDEWAVGLRKAGYATNPKYSVRIINLIIQHNLQAYTIEATVAKNPSSAEADLGKYNQAAVDAIQLSKTEKKKIAKAKEAEEGY